MDPNALAIPIAFILLAAVLCLLLIGSKWKWWQKLALIVIVPGFGLIVWASLASYKGWPTTSAPPEKSLVVWTVVREPDPFHGDPGAIYVWLIPYDEKKATLNPLAYDSPGNEPRSYALPYSRSMHKAMAKAQGLIKEGQPPVLDLSGQPAPGGEEGEGEEGQPPPGEGQQGDGGANGQNGPGPQPGGGDPDRRDIKVYPQPPPHPPQKLPEH